MYSFVILISFLLILPVDAWGAAAAKRIQEQKMMQEAMVRQQYQQMVAQKQAEIQQQVIMQRQAQMQAQQVVAYQKAAMEYAAYKQAMQQAMAKRNAELQAVSQVKEMIAQRQAQQVAQVQRAVAEKQVKEMVAHKQAVETQQIIQQKTQIELNQQVQQYAQYLAMRKQAMVGQAVAVQQVQTAQQMAAHAEYQKAAAAQNQAKMKGESEYDSVRRRLGKQAAQDIMMSQPKKSEASEPVGNKEDEIVVDIKDLWAALDGTSGSWADIVDAEIKTLTVAEYIDRFQKLGIKIKRKPGDYAKLIDAFAEQTPGFLDAPFMNILSYAAIVEYDFENGKNKDELARQLLGDENFEANRKRVFGP